MYRRLKNLLGVSLIILAIVLSQLPMGAVQADTTSQDGTEVLGENIAAEENNVLDETTGSEDETKGVTTTDEDTNEIVAVVAGDSDISTTDSSITHTVKFDYGFASLDGDTSIVQEMEVQENKLVNVSDSQWMINNKLLEPGETYNIDGREYKFVSWCSDLACKTRWELESDQVRNEMTLYADWEFQGNKEAVIKITYSWGNGDNEKEFETFTFGERIQGPKTNPYIDNSDFLGWFESRTNEKLKIGLIPIESMVYLADFKNSEYTVYFHANGGNFEGGDATDGTLETQTRIVTNGEKIDTNDYPTVKSDSYEGYTLEAGTWYKDQTCLEAFDEDSTVISTLNLYAKWAKDESGFKMNPGGTVLYSYGGTASNVEIPSTVKVIATGAFTDLSRAESITLPAGISDIRENAFPGVDSVTSTISLYASADETTNSVSAAEKLVKKYSYFKYKSTSGDGQGNPDSATAQISDIEFSLYKIAEGLDDNDEYVYPEVKLPYNLEGGKYQLTFKELNEPVKIHTFLKNAGYDIGSNYVYYMDISMVKEGAQSGFIPSWKSPATMSVTMPLPFSWYGRDTSKIHMFTINESGTALDEVTTSFADNNIFTCKLEHFSEYALVFSGKITSGGDSGNGGSLGGSGNGGSSGGNSGDGGSSGDSSDNGDSSGGGSGNGGSSGGSSGNSGGSGNGGSSGNNTSPAPGITTPTVTTPNIPLVTPAPAPGTQQAITTPAGTTGGSVGGGTTAHVKDSTPKTGEPLEYRSILVCSFFSIGVLLLLIGNKKKTSSSSRYLRV